MIASELLTKLDGVKKQRDGWIARCPAHNDRHASLSVGQGDKGIVLCCHAGCEPSAVCAALGLNLSDLFAEPISKCQPSRQIVTTYDYRDEDGKLLFQAVRFEPKGFSQRRPDGNAGWLWNLKETRRVLYRLPELLAADPRATVFICEGEKDVDKLRSLGLVATTNPQGAGKWRREYNDFLSGREVVIVPDNDQAGRNHAKEVAQSLHGVAASVKMLELSGLPAKGDLSDWLDAGNDVDTLCAMVDDLTEWTEWPPATEDKAEGAERASRLAVSWADFDSEQFTHGEQIAFAVERGEIALVNSLPNAGKTTLALNVAVSLASGRSFAPVVIEARERRVLYIDGETRRARLQRDLRTMTKTLSREETIAVGQNLHIICEAEIKGESLALTRTDHLLAISAEALRVKPDFIVVDTLSSLCPVFNENDNSEQQRKVWRPLQKLARDCDATILVLHHVGKRTEDSQTPERVYRGRGASASGGAARSVWLLIPDPLMAGLSTLSCVKAKGEAPKDTRLQLDAKSRWITALQIEPQKPVTPLERVLAVVNREMKISDIKAALKPEFSERTTETAIAEAVQLGKLTNNKRGYYSPVSANSAESAKQPDAEGAEVAETPEIEPETEFPQLPQPSIGVAEVAETITASEHNGLREKPQKAQKAPLRKPVNGKAEQSKFPQLPQPPMTPAESAETGREVITI